MAGRGARPATGLGVTVRRGAGQCRHLPRTVSKWVRQAATARTGLISAERIAAHMRAVQAPFAAVLTDFVRVRYPEVPGIEPVAEVARSTLAAALVVAVKNWRRVGCGDLGELVATAVALVRSGLTPPA